jgi:hypothetical protein
MRTTSRKVTLLIIDDNLDRKIEVEFGQSKHALRQYLALGKRQCRRLFRVCPTRLTGIRTNSLSRYDLTKLDATCSR